MSGDDPPPLNNSNEMLFSGHHHHQHPQHPLVHQISSAESLFAMETPDGTSSTTSSLSPAPQETSTSAFPLSLLPPSSSSASSRIPISNAIKTLLSALESVILDEGAENGGTAVGNVFGDALNSSSSPSSIDASSAAGGSPATAGVAIVSSSSSGGGFRRNSENSGGGGIRLHRGSSWDSPTSLLSPVFGTEGQIFNSVLGRGGGSLAAAVVASSSSLSTPHLFPSNTSPTNPSPLKRSRNPNDGSDSSLLGGQFKSQKTTALHLSSRFERSMRMDGTTDEVENDDLMLGDNRYYSTPGGPNVSNVSSTSSLSNNMDSSEVISNRAIINPSYLMRAIQEKQKHQSNTSDTPFSSEVDAMHFSDDGECPFGY